MTSKIRELEVSVASKSDNNSREDDIARLRSILEEETKEKNKVTLTLNDEISNLKREIKRCEEEVIISVREKSNLAEDNRILLKTIDALNVLVLTRNDKTTNGSKSDHNSAQKEVVSGSISENNTGAKKKLFQCNECVFTCTEKALLQKHTENQHKRIRTEYQCIQCGKGFESSDALKRHDNSSHSKSNFECKHCYFTTSNIDKLNDHVSGCHTLKAQYACIECDFVTTTTTSLSKHSVDVHGNTLKSYCRQCDKIFPHEQQLEFHRQQYHESPVLKCAQCDFISVIQYRMDKHLGECHNNSQWGQCTKCNFTSMSKARLDRHMMNNHNTVGDLNKSYSNSVGSTKNTNLNRNSRHDNRTSVTGMKYCYFYNHSVCRNSSQQCSYSHTKAPACKFQESCKSTKCPFQHTSMHFLEPTSRNIKTTSVIRQDIMSH